MKSALKILTGIIVLTLQIACSWSLNPDKSRFSYKNPPANPTPSSKMQHGEIFEFWGQRFTPIDIENQNLSIEIKPKARQAIATAVLTFTAKDNGFPYFDFVPNALEIEVKSKDQVWNAALLTIVDPSATETFKALNVAVEKDKKYEMKLSYAYPQITWLSDGGFQHRWDMSDIGSRQLLEKYAPANFLHDQFGIQLTVKVVDSPIPINVFSNGKFEKGLMGTSQMESAEWQIQFPYYFNISCPFFEISTTEYSILNDSVVSARSGQIIPIFLYTNSYDRDVLKDSAEIIKKWLPRFEEQIGPYAHDSFVGLITGRNGGGMEYAGATISSVNALQHELFHSWFARGAIAGNDGGWIDEAVNNWQGANYPRVDELSSRSLIQFAGRSPLYRDTNRKAYTEGLLFMSEMNGLFDGRFRNVIADFYKAYFRKPYSTLDFLNFIGARLPQDKLEDYEIQTREYVYGLDCQWLRKPALAAMDSENIFYSQFDIDVLANDISCGPSPLEISDYDRTSQQGGTIELIYSNTGVPYLRYLAKEGFTGYDSFHYKLSQHDTGLVRVYVRPFLTAIDVADTEKGIIARYYDISPSSFMPDFGSLTPFWSEVVSSIDFTGGERGFAGSGRKQHVGAVFEGYFDAPEDSLYNFALRSDDGSRMYIGDLLLIDISSHRDQLESRNKVGLQKGLHRLRIEYFQDVEDSSLRLSGQWENRTMSPLNNLQLRHKK